MSELEELKREKAELSKCLAKSINGDIMTVIYGNKINLETEEKLSEVEVAKRIVKNAKPIFRFTPDYVFLTLEFPNDNDADLLSVGHLFETYLDKSTKSMVEDNKFFDLFTFLIDVVTIEADKTYSVSVHNPMFKYRESNRLNFVFPMDTLNYHIMDSEYGDVEREAILESL